jgi:hypothetical protein
MSTEAEFSREKAERLLGPAAIARARQIVDAAPPLSPEVREKLRAVFATARTARPAAASKAA